MTAKQTWIDPDSEPTASKIAQAIGDELRTHKALGFQWTLALIVSALREAKREAYEEAAQAVRAQCDAKGTGCLAHCTHLESVEAIRALAPPRQLKGE